MLRAGNEAATEAARTNQYLMYVCASLAQRALGIHRPLTNGIWDKRSSICASSLLQQRAREISRSKHHHRHSLSLLIVMRHQPLHRISKRPPDIRGWIYLAKLDHMIFKTGELNAPTLMEISFIGPKFFNDLMGRLARWQSIDNLIFV